MKRIYSHGLLTVALCLLTGCMSFEIEGDGYKTPKSIHGVATVHGSYYGYTWKKWDKVKVQDNLGLYRVEYSTNIFYALASIFSLGLYVPQDIEWWCQSSEPPENEGPSLSYMP